MANLTKQLKQLSFEGIDFPYKEITLSGEMRFHTHEYPHSPGGLPEKLGRRLYDVDITTIFHGDLLPKRYANLWPDNLAQLVTLFEQGKTGDLFLPQIGAPIRAFCTNWKRVLSSTRTSGEAVTLKFLEDSERLKLAENTLSIAKGLSNTMQALQLETENIKPRITLLDKILSLVNEALAIKDQWDLYGQLLEAKLLSIISMIQQVLDTNEQLMSVDYWLARDLLSELWAQTLSLTEDMQQRGELTRTWNVRSTGTLSQVAVEIYGSSQKASELMALNAINDPFVIAAGTALKYYAEAA